MRETGLKASVELWTDADIDHHPEAGRSCGLRNEAGGTAYDGNDRRAGTGGEARLGNRCGGPWKAALPAVVLVASLSACGGAAGYTVPQEVCGRKIDPGLVRPLLPEGERFEAETTPIGDDMTRCLLSVDGRTELGIREYRDGGEVDVMEFATEHPELFRNTRKATFGAETAVSDGAVLSVNPCTYQGRTGDYILDIRIYRFDVSEPDGWRAELERFAEAYLPVGMEETGCEK